jgi:hypothetical protein
MNFNIELSWFLERKSLKKENEDYECLKSGRKHQGKQEFFKLIVDFAKS